MSPALDMVPRPLRGHVVQAWRLASLDGRRRKAADGPMFCRALAGMSDYNICINSDMTVSCNCRDFDGSGLIGDLERESLDEIFGGSTVASFQERLFRGEMPTSVCRICRERVSLSDCADPVPGVGRVPTRGLMLENTSRCNLSCHLCDREGLLARRRRHSLAHEDMLRAADELAAHRIERVYYFSLGEPFLSTRVLQDVELLRNRLPHVRIITSTNGVHLDSDDKVEAALRMDHVVFSIDGVDQATLERYQRGGDFERSFRNLSRLVSARNERAVGESDGRRPIVEWKYVMFRWNDRARHVRRALELARSAGVDRITFAPGETSIRDMSKRYYTDSLLLGAGRRTEVGIVFDFVEIPEEFD